MTLHAASFHSYRGGRGRTTAVVSTANVLYRLGHDVLIIDLDITAPWVHAMYGLEVGQKRNVGDLLSYVSRFRRGTIGEVNLDDYTYDITAQQPGHVTTDSGSIRLLSPGDPQLTSYWQWVAAEIPTLMGLRLDSEIAEVWRDLRRIIGHSAPSIDFLLIDAPAGLHHASVLAGAGFSDTAAFFTTADEPSLEITARLMSDLREERTEAVSRRFGALRVIGVRGRYPTYLDADATIAEAAELEVRDKLGGQSICDGVVTVPSDPQLEQSGVLPVDLARNVVVRSPLAEGYVKLACELFPEAVGTPEDVWEALPHLPPDSRLRLFWLAEQGVLTNPADSAPNVAFRVQTFCGLIDDVHSEYLERRAPRAWRRREVRSAPAALEEAGRLSGTRFGKDLRDQSDFSDLSRSEIIERWCVFDSEVGFGRLQLLEHHRSTMGPEEGVVEVQSNFLAMGRMAGTDQDLCPILVGYMSGVLGALFDRDVRVTHQPGKCMYHRVDRSSCEFEFGPCLSSHDAPSWRRRSAIAEFLGRVGHHLNPRRLSRSD